MPRAPRFKIAAVAELLRQLEFAPAETRRRQMDAAERLIGDVDPSQNYPQDFIIYRITGYRPDTVDEPVTFVGDALLPDLLNLVRRLSETLDGPAERGGRAALPLPEVARRLGVSLKTVQRYRKQGLVCHRLRFARAKSAKLACHADALERFRALHRKRLERAAGFQRIDPDTEEAIIASARELRQRERLSLNEAALRLARAHGRAHETIRMLLRRHDRGAAEPIFAERGPLGEREIRVLHRAWRLGVDPARLAARFCKSKPAIHRAIARRRCELLRALPIEFVQLATFDRPDAQEVILAAPAVTNGLNDLPPDDDALAFISALQAGGGGGGAGAAAADESAEHAMIAAYNLLKMRAATALRQEGWPGADAVDAIETDLRWAAKLQRRLVAFAWPAALRRIEHHLNRPLREHPAEQMLFYLDLAGPVLVEAVEGLDPGRDQRLERIAGFGMERRLARLSQAGSARKTHGAGRAASGRAAALHMPASMPMAPRLETLAPWAAWLELRRALRAHVGGLDERTRALVMARYGLEGGPPRTIARAAAVVAMTPIKAARELQRAVRALRGMARGATGSGTGVK